jgi:alcohol oxidase
LSIIVVANPWAITQEYPFSRGFVHVNSPDPYEVPDFDAGFMNDNRDMAPMVWGYIKSRETARRMHAYAGEVTAMHPHFAFDSPARALDMDIATTNAYAGPDHITANIQHGEYGHGMLGRPLLLIGW